MRDCLRSRELGNGRWVGRHDKWPAAWSINGQCRPLLIIEELAKPRAYLAALGIAVIPLMRVDPKGGVRFAVAETTLNVDEVVVERDQHAGVAVAEVVQRRLRRLQLGGFAGAF